MSFSIRREKVSLVLKRVLIPKGNGVGVSKKNKEIVRVASIILRNSVDKGHV